jgi:uncharacterized protein (TIGR02453 family)
MKNTFKFLTALDKNNNREWFQQNKVAYEQSLQEMIQFADDVIEGMNKEDYIDTQSGKRSLYRIYRDVRFGNDKTPYKTNWAGRLKRATPERRGGYYYQVGPFGSFVMGGFFGPNPKDLLHIRKQIEMDPKPFRDVIGSTEFRSFFGKLLGSRVKTAPRGFSIDDEAIDLLRYKQFMVRHDFSKKQVLSKDFPATVVHAFSQMRPFFDYMSEILTTDLNGRPFL